MVAVDTSILVRIFTQDDPALAAKADHLVQQSKPRSLLLDRLVLAELGYVLRSRYTYSKSDVVKIYKSLLADEHFNVIDNEVVGLAINYFETEIPLSFEDCWLLALKQAGKVENVLTFDTDLQKHLKN